jgi:hypothetical protein
MRKTIRPDGSLDPVADFEDDGASFRVRREVYLTRQERRRNVWARPRNGKEAVRDGLKIGLGIGALAIMLPVGMFAGMIILWLIGAK